jgi:hypothetical protein
MAEYQYAPLKKGEFRLLRFRSGQEDSSQDFALDIIHRNMKDSADMAEQGGYVAISYAWDTSFAVGESAQAAVSPPDCFSILPPGLRLWTRVQEPRRPRVAIGDENAFRIVTPTLHALLSTLYGKVSQLFWIDQLCINQDDKDEKEIQVENMGQIYSGAQKVVVWLGPEENPATGTEGSDAAINFLHHLCRELEVYGLPANNESPARYQEVVEALNATIKSPDVHPLIDRSIFLETMKARLLGFPFDAVARFLERRWFTRIWTIQEVCLAKEVVFICGNKKILWSVLRDAASILALFDLVYGSNAGGIRNEFDADAISRFSAKLGLLNVKRVAHLVRTRRSLVDYNEKHTLLSLVKRFNVNTDVLLLGASDRRDRIFGLLGMATKGFDMKRKYKRQVEYVYTKFAAQEITAGNIDLLALSSSSKSLPETLFPSLPSMFGRPLQGILQKLLPHDALCRFPTWVPDWDPPLRGSLRRPYGFNGDLNPLFSAGRDVKQNISFCDNVLKVQGKLIDVVDETSDTFVQLDPNLKNSIDAHCCVYYLKDIERLCVKARSKKTSYSDEWLQDASWRVAVGGVATHISKTYCRADEQSFHWREERAFLLRLFLHIHYGSSTWANFNTFRKAHRCNERGLLGSLRSSLRNMSWLASKWLIDLALFVGERRWWEIPLQAIGDLPPSMGQFCGALFDMRDRRAYLTQTGYVGLGPLTLRKGDLIVVLGGGSVPFALRRTWNGKYKLLGEAYCDECMGPEPPAGELVDFELV